jgi:hypothetical protein
MLHCPVIYQTQSQALPLKKVAPKTSDLSREQPDQKKLS